MENIVEHNKDETLKEYMKKEFKNDISSIKKFLSFVPLIALLLVIALIIFGFVYASKFLQ